MANDVFANGREISCKAADGKSIAAFPDVCFTPPECPATPPGVPIPYPNTAFAKDTRNGSKTVKISGKEVMLKNVSYFKTSTGDEAGCAAKKGVVTSVNKGKAYFTSWSMNVKFETKNVVRHLDLTTHNHGSQPGNTPPWVYTDTGTISKTCKEELKLAKKKCEPTSDQEDDFKKEQKRKNQRRKKKKKPLKKERKMGWKDAHCKGLLRIKPYTDIENFRNSIEQSLLSIKDKMLNFEEILKEKGIEIAEDKAIKTVKKAGVKYGISASSGPLAPVLGFLATAHSLLDGVNSAAVGTADVYVKYQEIKGELGPLKDLVNRAVKQLEDAKEGVKLLKKEKDKTLSALEEKKLKALKRKVADHGRKLANMQAVQAKKDPCLKALKCFLTPFNQNQAMSSKKGTKPTLTGCCPGQTGHHLPPKGYFHECQKKGGYNEQKALVVCAEGTDQRSGSHGRLHDEQDAAAQKLMKDGELSFDDAIAASVTAHGRVFQHCQSKCIKAQLLQSLAKCKKYKINAINKENKPLKPSAGDASFQDNVEVFS